MMTASPNDAWLRHILRQTSHHCDTQWSNIIFAKQMHHIAEGDASFDIQANLCYNKTKKGGIASINTAKESAK